MAVTFQHPSMGKPPRWEKVEDVCAGEDERSRRRELLTCRDRIRPTPVAMPMRDTSKYKVRAVFYNATRRTL